jgi:hypothetical protein
MYKTQRFSKTHAQNRPNLSFFECDLPYARGERNAFRFFHTDRIPSRGERNAFRFAPTIALLNRSDRNAGTE